MCDTATHPSASRFAKEVVALNSQLSFGRLLNHLDGVEPHHLAVRPDGLTTIAVRTDELPERYLLGLQGFRLAQYLQLGWACQRVVHSVGMFSESTHGLHAEDVHVITLDSDGKILGYVSLATSGDREPRDPLADDRAPFPVEVAHDINIFDRVEPLAGVRTDQIRELKRFVHSRTMKDKAQRLRVTLELLLGAGRVLTRVSPSVRTLVGDVEEHVALRHLMMAGLEVQMVEGTAPRLPDSDVMYHLYTARAVVKPFVAHVPDQAELVRRVDFLEASIANPDVFRVASSLPATMPGSMQRIAA